MKKQQVLLLLFALLSSTCALRAQTNYDFTYDAAGNRIRRAVVVLSKGDCPGETGGRSDASDSQVIETDEGIRLFPNPTKGMVRLEAAGADKVDYYLLSDVHGRRVDSGKETGPTLSFDLSGQPSGIYLLEVVVGGNTTYYKIIKQ